MSWPSPIEPAPEMVLSKLSSVPPQAPPTILSPSPDSTISPWPVNVTQPSITKDGSGAAASVIVPWLSMVS